MDFTRNIDKVDFSLVGVSYNQILDVSNEAAVATEPVTLQDIKDWGKIDLSTDDTILSALITAARRMCEQYSGMNFTARTVTAIINNLNSGTYLPYGPIGAIASMTDMEGNVIDSGSYKITGNQFKQVQWPTMEYLSITYTGGYTTLPEDLKTAIKAQALYLSENRGDIGMSPLAMQILNPIRRVQ